MRVGDGCPLPGTVEDGEPGGGLLDEDDGDDEQPAAASSAMTVSGSAVRVLDTSGQFPGTADVKQSCG